MPKLTAESFLSVLKQSGLIHKDQIKRLVAEALQAGVNIQDSDALATYFVQREQLTQWQVDKLQQGKHKGFTLGKYRLLRLLGKGGMSSVYLAEHVLMRRRCAIKVLPIKRVNDTSYLARFHREAQAVASLDHPNIVRAYDIDHEIEKDTEIHFLVMEYVSGRSLQEVVKESGLLSVESTAAYIAQAALGLDHAHKAGLVHRDVKPGNLLVDSNGIVKLLDLGLALFSEKTEENPLTVTYDEKVLGTADYLSPEQALDSHLVDLRADIYSLGCTIYYCLTGHPPFKDGTLAQRLMWHQTKDPPSITEERPDVPESFLSIVKLMMAKKPEARFQSMALVADSLIGWLRDNASAEFRQHWGGLMGSASGPGIGSGTALGRAIQSAPTAPTMSEPIAVAPAVDAQPIEAAVIPFAPPEPTTDDSGFGEFFQQLQQQPVAQPAAPVEVVAAPVAQPIPPVIAAPQPIAVAPAPEPQPTEVMPWETPVEEPPQVAAENPSGVLEFPSSTPGTPANMSDTGSFAASAPVAPMQLTPTQEIAPPVFAAPVAAPVQAAPAAVAPPIAAVAAPAWTPPVAAVPQATAIASSPVAAAVTAMPVAAIPVQQMQPAPMAAIPVAAAPVATTMPTYATAQPVIAQAIPAAPIQAVTTPVAAAMPTAPTAPEPILFFGAQDDTPDESQPFNWQTEATVVVPPTQAPTMVAQAVPVAQLPGYPPTAQVAYPVDGQPVTAVPVAAAAVPLQPMPAVPAKKPFPAKLIGLIAGVLLIAGVGGFIAINGSSDPKPPKKNATTASKEKTKDKSKTTKKDSAQQASAGSPAREPKPKPAPEPSKPITSKVIDVGPEGHFKEIWHALSYLNKERNKYSGAASKGGRPNVTLAVAGGQTYEAIAIDNHGGQNYPGGIHIIARGARAKIKPREDGLCVRLISVENFRLENFDLDSPGKDAVVEIVGYATGGLNKLSISGYTKAGILAQGFAADGAEATIQEVDFRAGNDSAVGIQFNKSLTSTRYVTVKSCRFIGPHKAAVEFTASAKQMQFRENIFDQGQVGVSFAAGGEWEYILFGNNTFFGQQRAGISFAGMPAEKSNNLVFHRNLFVKGTGPELLVEKDFQQSAMETYLFKKGNEKGVSDNWTDRKEPAADAKGEFELITDPKQRGAAINFASTDSKSPDFLALAPNAPMANVPNQSALLKMQSFVGARPTK